MSKFTHADLPWDPAVNLMIYESREEQFAARQSTPYRVNASEVSALFGTDEDGDAVNRYLSPFALAQLKLGNELPAADAKLAKRGHRYERAIAEDAVDYLNDNAPANTRYELVWLPPYCGIMHQDFPSVASTPDAMILCIVSKKENGITSDAGSWFGPLECKKVRYNKRDDWEGGPPVGYLLQNQTQMITCGATKGVIAGLIGDEIHVEIVERHEAICNTIIESTTTFLTNLMQGILPPVDGHEATSKALQRFYKAKGDSVIQLPPDFASVVLELEQAKEEKKRIEERCDELSNKIKAALGENTIGKVLGYEVSWKPQGGNPTMLKVDLRMTDQLVAAGIPYEIKASPVVRVLRTKRTK